MLDMKAIFAAADAINGKHGKQKTGHFQARETGLFPVQTQHPCGLQGLFEAWETRETDLRGGGAGTWILHPAITKNSPLSPAPPDSGLERAEPESLNNTVSLVSQEREPLFQQGLAGGFCGKQPCFPLFPVFPVSHLDDYAIQERAAIMEYDGGLSREVAEAAVGLR